MSENLEILEDILDTLKIEQRKIQTLFNQNMFQIEEINSYLNELLTKEDDDFKVFSPRDVESIHKEQMEADEIKKKSYEKENEVYQEKLDFLEKLIDKLNLVIHNLLVEERTVKEENVLNDKSEVETEKNDEIQVFDKEHVAH